MQSDRRALRIIAYCHDAAGGSTLLKFALRLESATRERVSRPAPVPPRRGACYVKNRHPLAPSWPAKPQGRPPDRLVRASGGARCGKTALAAGPPFLGNWARGDGKTHIRVERCGAAFCGVNTWVRPGVSGEKVGDRLVANVSPARAARWSGSAFDPLHNADPCRRRAHDHRRMCVGRHDVSQYGLDAPRSSALNFRSRDAAGLSQAKILHSAL